MTQEELARFRDLASKIQLDENGELRALDQYAMAGAEMVMPLLAHIDAQAAQISQLKGKLVEERASKKISKFCNCERCWPLGQPKSERRIAAEEKVRQEARQQLKAEMPEVSWDA